MNQKLTDSTLNLNPTNRKLTLLSPGFQMWVFCFFTHVQNFFSREENAFLDMLNESYRLASALCGHDCDVSPNG